MNWTRRLRLRHLQLLVSLAETGSLSDTAKLAHTTQPGLSKWLKELEEDAGAELFEAQEHLAVAHGAQWTLATTPR